MPHIAIISSSVRIDRKSHRVALYFEKYLTENNICTTEILDLKIYDFPIFDERLKFQKNASAKALEFAEKIISADGIIIVTPEYNGGYPASLKNIIDLLYEEWRHKPVGIATVSAGIYGGSQVLTSIQFSLWKMKVWTIPATFPVSNVDTAYDELGNASDKLTTDAFAAVFVMELLWCIKADNGSLNNVNME
jgi:NAD(P)H-dependent FMN reductase